MLHLKPFTNFKEKSLYSFISVIGEKTPIIEKSLKENYSAFELKPEVGDFVSKINKIRGRNKFTRLSNESLDGLIRNQGREELYLNVIQGRLNDPTIRDELFSQVRGMYEVIKDNGVCEWAGMRGKTFLEGLEIVAKPAPRHNWFTKVWCEYYMDEYYNNVRFVFKFCRISKITLYKLRKGYRLSKREFGQVSNFPYPIINADGFYVDRLVGNFGDRPPRVDKVGVQTLLDVKQLLKNRDFIGRLPDIESLRRINGGRDAAFIPIKRCCKKSTNKYDSKYLIETFIRCTKFEPFSLPRLSGLQPHSLVLSGTVNRNKTVGAVSRMINGKQGKKKDFLVPGYAVALEVVDKLKRGKDIFDLGIYTFGGRPKVVEGKAVGTQLAGRPVWIAPLVGEIMSSFISDCMIFYFKKTDRRCPIYIGKTLDRGQWIDVFKGITSNRTCYHGDYSKWDSTVPRALIDVSFSILRQCLPKGDFWDRYLMFLYSGFAYHPAVLNNGAVIGFQHGVPSGHKFTSLLNSLCNYLISCIHMRESGVLSDLEACEKKHQKIRYPFLKMFTGDDFGIVSKSAKFDDYVKRMGNVSQVVAGNLDMELDPPYIGNFAIDDPDQGGFEYLKTRFTKDMLPTLKSENIIKRFIMPEKRSTERNYNHRSSIIAFPPVHEKGLSVYSSLKELCIARTGSFGTNLDEFTFMGISLSRIQDDRDTYYYKPKKKGNFLRDGKDDVGELLDVIQSMQTEFCQLRTLKNRVIDTAFSTFGRGFTEVINKYTGVGTIYQSVKKYGIYRLKNDSKRDVNYDVYMARKFLSEYLGYDVRSSLVMIKDIASAMAFNLYEDLP